MLLTLATKNYSKELNMIDLVSDIHLEFGHCDLRETDSKYLILAGDIQPISMTIEGEGARFFDAVADQYDKVFYIIGNHEYYGAEIHYDTLYELRENLPENTLVMDPVLGTDLEYLEEFTIVGATLWTDLTRNPKHFDMAQRGMNDFRHIWLDKESNTKFHASVQQAFYEEHLARIKSVVPDPSKPFIVVTHTSPQYDPEQHVKFRDFREMDFCFHNELGDYIRENAITAWCHGHTHEKVDYMLGHTAIKCNPRGYYAYETWANVITPMRVL